LVQNHDFKIIVFSKENKGKVFKFVGFKTTWASKIIEKPLDQAKKCPFMFRAKKSIWDGERRVWFRRMQHPSGSKNIKKHWFFNKKLNGEPRCSPSASQRKSAQVSARQRKAAQGSEWQGQNASQC